MAAGNQKGSYGFDVEFLRKHNIEIIELKDSSSGARVLVAPGLQGRVMTTSAEGEKGKSFGWINYRHIESGVISQQFNPFGGEERLWLGPEGGPFSIYFKNGVPQDFANWKVPAELDTKPFRILEKSESDVAFSANFSLENYKGEKMEVGIYRNLTLLPAHTFADILGIVPDASVSAVGYESENVMSNEGKKEWTKESGFLSIWMLSMFNPSENGVVFIPFKAGDTNVSGPVVNDDYFGKVPAERLKVKDSVIFFRTDGKYRSKIGISPLRAEPLCGSFDPDGNVLTVLWFSQPEKVSQYVNSKWGEQADPLSGDVVNSYNDGPVDDGSVMGPFYEIESSSPAALLKPGETISHVQRIFHFTGPREKLNVIAHKLFNLDLSEIEAVF